MDFQDYPVQPKTFSWKPALIVGTGVVVAVVIIAGVFFFVRSHPKLLNQIGSAVTAHKTAEDVALDDCKSTPNQQGCKDYVTQTFAASKKDASSCLSLSGSAKDNCIWGVAAAAKDDSLCKQLSKSDQAQMCADRILQQKAVDASDETMCDKLYRDVDKQNCHNALLATVTTENCAARKQDPTYCEFLRVADTAIKAQDRDLCNPLKNQYVSACRARVVFDDPDHDGLSSWDEIHIYHTDPRNPDTDGDGFPDGVEVKSGHNPLKKG